MPCCCLGECSQMVTVYHVCSVYTVCQLLRKLHTIRLSYGVAVVLCHFVWQHSIVVLPVMVKAKAPSKPNAKSRNKSVTEAGKRDRCGKKPDHLIPMCYECEEVIKEHTEALQCERCTQSEVWKCASCLGVSDELYDQSTASFTCNLHWYCDKCEAASVYPVIDSEHVIPLIDQLQSRTVSIEAQLLRRFADLDQKFAVLSTKIDDKLVQKFTQVESVLAPALDQCTSKIFEPLVDKFQQKLDEKVDQLKLNVTETLQKLWKSHSILISVKIWLVKALVWPVAMYGCKSWTVRKNEETHCDTFKMKGLRKIQRVSWTAKKTNEWVLNKAGVKR